ncbi:MAG: HlyC/CorC family transporter [Bacteroidaceae bacterium]|nr:HlyC/CorC family transporter [Bacteroidaceae bacterium]MBQ8454649.1 HlyC/CorC family transporter [Bacteroidaceae bacterium]MBQ9169535.1 HlyC/CorC family transporter [Bacteroidaceae bacterium]MBQ9294215.1 HlyC/CorC family transporter [Bacteroidaceae bacterium]
MIDTSTIIATIVILLLSGFFSGMEIAFVSSSKLRFEMDREEQGFSSRLIDTFYRHPNSFISTLLVGNNIALVVYGILMARIVNALLLIPLGIHHPDGDCPNEALCLFLQTILATFIVLVTGEFLPKTLFRINPNKMMRIFALPAYFFYIILWPISKFTSSLGKLLLWMIGEKVKKAKQEKTFTREDLDYLIQSNIEKATDDEDIEDEVKIFQNALDFSSVKVRDCIVPRTEITAVAVDTSLQELRTQFVESGHSKIIVYKEDIDDIVGYIHTVELFRLAEDEDWTEHIREVPIVPETMNAQKLLGIFISQKRSLAVIVDEFGGTSGIVTMEDLVEEIFGEIEDEHDSKNYTARQTAPGEYQLSGRLEIAQANELLDLDLPESDEYLTVGGLILHEFQNFPKLNEPVRIGKWEFKVTKKTTTKIELVQLRILDK